MKTDRLDLLKSPIFFNNPHFAFQIIILLMIALSIIVFNMIVVINIIFANK